MSMNITDAMRIIIDKIDDLNRPPAIDYVTLSLNYTPSKYNGVRARLAYYWDDAKLCYMSDQVRTYEASAEDSVSAMIALAERILSDM